MLPLRRWGRRWGCRGRRRRGRWRGGRRGWWRRQDAHGKSWRHRSAPQVEDVKVHLLLVKGANALPGCVEGVGMVCSRQLSVVVRKGGIG
jgi:hypothetical protein